VSPEYYTVNNVSINQSIGSKLYKKKDALPGKRPTWRKTE